MHNLPHSIVAERHERMARSKRQWLETHGRKRPEHEVQYERENLEALEQSHDSHAAAARRDAERAA